MFNPGIEPRDLQGGRQKADPDAAPADRGDRKPASLDVDGIVHEEHRVDAANVRGVLDAERSKPPAGGLPLRHVACISPPLARAWTSRWKRLSSNVARSERALCTRAVTQSLIKADGIVERVTHEFPPYGRGGGVRQLRTSDRML